MLCTKPPGARTGYSHPSCYARVLGDCSEKLSREHYISKKLLERLGPSFMVDGVPWHEGPKSVTPDNLAAKVLCQRHNEALGPLDNNITDLYDALILWHDGHQVGVRGFDGEDIERWALKAMIGFLVSGSATDLSGRKARARTVPEDYLRVLFGEAELSDGCGLWVKREQLPIADRRSISLQAIAVAKGPDVGKIFGVGISMTGLSFITTVAMPLVPPEHYRPREFRLDGSGSLHFRWASSTTGKTLLFTKEA
jgi:hypothetical protein